MGSWPPPAAASQPNWPPGVHAALRFDAFMDSALYHPTHGFYSGGRGGPGRRGDFLTSVEVGPLFGAVTARYLDHVWDELGRPHPFRVADVGAGPGTWARTIKAARPRCQTALALTLVERSAQARASHPTEVAGTVGGLAELGCCHVILANELLDNLAVRICQHDAGRWQELWVGPQGEELRPLADRADLADGAGMADHAGLADGARIPLAEQAFAWVTQARKLLEPGGRLLVFDYGATTAELAQRPDAGWLRTYRDHQQGRAAWQDPGTQDITCEVAFDQLPVANERISQSSWLRRWGLAELVEEGRAHWKARAAVADLAAWAARSRIREAEALADPAGLGGFWVAQWNPSEPMGADGRAAPTAPAAPGVAAARSAPDHENT